jgi:two-component system LytT family sensor kinase
MSVKKDAEVRRISKHVLFWLAYILYETIWGGMENSDTFVFDAHPRQLINLPVEIAVAYVNLYVLLPAFYYRRKYGQYALMLIILLLLNGIAERYLGWAIWVNWDKVHNPAEYLLENKNFFIPVRILRNAVQTFPVVAATLLLKLMDNSFKQEQRMQEMEKKKLTAELGFLKAQINPHFFFNTLNSLYALTLKGSRQASKVVLRLSDLMHYMIYDANAGKVLLRDEIKYLENYISIEQMRFADRLDLSFQYSGEIEGKFIAPLLLLPFIENAFKHGIEDNAGWITINLKVISSTLFLKVENSCAAVSKQKGNGLGLANVRRRLELTYPDSHELTIHQVAGVFEVELSLSL